MAEDFFGAIGKFFARAAVGAADKTSSMMEKSKINSQITGERKEIEKLCQQIGESVLERAAAGEIQLSERENLLMEEINVHQVRIREFRKVMAGLRNMKICPACESLIAIDVAFCPKCGAPTPVPEPEEVMAEEIVFDDADISYEEVDMKEEAEASEEPSEETIFVEEPEVTEEIRIEEGAKAAEEPKVEEEPGDAEKIKVEEEPEAGEEPGDAEKNKLEEELEAGEEPKPEEETKAAE